MGRIAKTTDRRQRKGAAGTNLQASDRKKAMLCESLHIGDKK
jgi:hypothetical protein